MKQTFNASSLDSSLPLRFEGKVQSVFSKAFNIRTKENELISIVATEKLNGPNRILLKLPEDEDFISFGIKKEARAVGTTQKISINNGNFLISLREAKKWSPKVEIEKKRPSSRVRDNLASLQKDFSTEKEKNKKASPITRGEPCFLSSFENSISQELRIRTQELTKSIKERNLPEVSKNIKRLIGFGEGLTPSGDDFLVGLIASLHFLGNSESQHLLKKIKRIINLEKEKTTFLSGKFLEYACQGRFPETILYLIEAIFSGSRQGTEKTARRCLDFGATSGRDTLLGIVGGLGLMVQSPMSKVQSPKSKWCR
ncbi:DUF2877 domain-containing protein [bacterium]|nr:DUF2877 domain-containing protein [bacterium]MCG2677978.1 DUF2877 domain-containing protein [bacterium]